MNIFPLKFVLQEGHQTKMAKLYFKYGAMGSSKSAQALITKFNYEERGMQVWLIKPAVDDRDGADIIKSRIGLNQKAQIIRPDDSIEEILRIKTKKAAEGSGEKIDVIISDESQFFTVEQIDELRRIVDLLDIPVLCFGLRTDFRTKLFPGSLRLFELADSITEIKTICDCGKKATVNARIAGGKVVTSGEQVFLGGNEAYVAMCHSCWKKRIAREAEEKNKTGNP